MLRSTAADGSFIGEIGRYLTYGVFVLSETNRGSLETLRQATIGRTMILLLWYYWYHWYCQ